MPGKISKKQQEILDYLKKEIKKQGYPPTVREICHAVNLKSTSSVHAHLETLERNGYIRRDPSKPRAIMIMGNDCDSMRSDIMNGDCGSVRRDITDVPMIGYVAAGEPLFAEQNVENHMPIPADMLPNQDCYMLKVRGESMIGVGIMNGDYVLVEKKNIAENGEIIVALVEDGATVKRFYKENGIYRLQPENPEMEPILVSEVKILGKVIGVMRWIS